MITKIHRATLVALADVHVSGAAAVRRGGSGPPGG